MEDGDLKRDGPTAQKQKRRSLSAQIAEERLASQIAKRRQQEMLLAKARGELVLKELVQQQAAYLLITLRQEILAAPGAWAPKLTGMKTVEQMAEALRGLTRDWLERVADMPTRVSDPDWLTRLSETEAGANGGGV